MQLTDQQRPGPGDPGEPCDPGERVPQLLEVQLAELDAPALLLGTVAQLGDAVGR